MDKESFYTKMKRLGLWDKPISEVANFIDEKDKEIERLKKSARVEHERFVSALGDLQSKDFEISELHSNLAEKDKEIERLKAELKVAYAINKQNITMYDADTLLKEDGDGETDNYES
jgi:predicted RNase H-like nuclease (RuvC/YqgF family)